MNAGPKFQDFATQSNETSTSQSRRGASLEARLLRRLLNRLGDPPIEFLLAWTGERVASCSVKPLGHVRLLDRGTLLGMIGDPQIRFGDAYSAGRAEVAGDLVQFMHVVYRAFAHANVRNSFVNRVWRWLRPQRNTLDGSRDNIHWHYDLGNDFYALWLGETMAYTCAYYPSVAATLEQAQIAKMDHVCRKLQIRSGDAVVEAGCGWGSLALHIARRYGAKVRAFNFPGSRSNSRAAGRGSSNWTAMSSLSRTITGTSQAAMTYSFPWGCSSTLVAKIMRRSAGWCGGSSVPGVAG